MRIMKLLATFLLLVVAALVVIPLIVLAGLFIWLKLTEEGDEESRDLDQDNI